MYMIKVILPSFMLSWIVLTYCQPLPSESLEATNKEKKEISNNLDSIARFLTEALHTCRTDIAYGELATARGSSDWIRQYGEIMIRDHTELLNGITALAISKKIKLQMKQEWNNSPTESDLADMYGEAFDKTFIALLVQGHSQGIKSFERASVFEDSDVKRFVIQYLPLLKSHLNEVEEIRNNQFSGEIN